MKTPEQKQLAKQVSIIEILASVGIKPEKTIGNQLVYFSPFRTENTPSLFVNPTKNVFKDFGGIGGDNIKLVMQLRNCGYPQAIDFLLGFDGSGLNLSDTEKQMLRPAKQKTNFQIIGFDVLTNEHLLKYSRQRGIDDEITKFYCHEVTYTNNGKQYKAIGFKNDSNGFELRANKFQSCIGTKDITTIGNRNGYVLLFEGFFDFLSFRQLSSKSNETLFDNYIILNSVNILSKAPLNNYNPIYLYLDNDKAGITAKEKILKENPLKTIIDCSKSYQNYKDYNDFLIHLTNGKKEPITLL